MDILNIFLIILYWAFASWTILLTGVNFILKPYLAINTKKVYSIEGGIVWVYVILWTIVLASPHVYAQIVG